MREEGAKETFQRQSEDIRESVCHQPQHLGTHCSGQFLVVLLHVQRRCKPATCEANRTAAAEQRRQARNSRASNSLTTCGSHSLSTLPENLPDTDWSFHSSAYSQINPAPSTPGLLKWSSLLRDGRTNDFFFGGGIGPCPLCFFVCHLLRIVN